jgi:hypothetical protein
LVNAFGEKTDQQIERIESGVALRSPPHSKECRLAILDHGRHSYFALEVLPSSNLAVAAARLSFCSDLF